MMATKPTIDGWRKERQDLLRAIAAGAITGIPLLYTMELWWHGMMLSEWHLLALLAVTLCINFGFCLFSGFRDRYTVGEAADEAITAVAIALFFSISVLWLIGEVTFVETGADIVGRVLIAAVPVSLGISFANSQVRGKSRFGDDRQGPDIGSMPRPERHRRQLRDDLRNVGVTISGALVFAFNIAPTEEVLKIAQRMPAWRSVVLLGASLGLCYSIGQIWRCRAADGGTSCPQCR
jgi:putative integral membrane protein (TIGR02587 family)